MHLLLLLVAVVLSRGLFDIPLKYAQWINTHNNEIDKSQGAWLVFPVFTVVTLDSENDVVLLGCSVWLILTSH